MRFHVVWLLCLNFVCVLLVFARSRVWSLGFRVSSLGIWSVELRDQGVSGVWAMGVRILVPDT